MKSASAYAPTSMERAAKQEQRHEKKKMRAQVWRSWVDEDMDDDQDVPVEGAEKKPE